MRAADFDYALPPELIAQRPPAERSSSRMLVLDRRRQQWSDRSFLDLPSMLERRDCLAVNDSRVLAARLLGRRVLRSGAPGGKAEVFLLAPLSPGSSRWSALVRPAKRLRPGAEVTVGSARIRIAGRGEGGLRTVEFPGLGPDGVGGLLRRHGHVPLPPYIRREDEPDDRERYQTVFARRAGSVAAPTAGLHFDAGVVRRIRRRGASLARVTLHVGPGTFRPVKSERVAEHVMHAERYEVRPAAADALRAARRVVAVGTTVVRTLESVVAEHGGVVASAGETDLFIRPGFRFRATGALLTNFHLPKSTLLMLVSAFAGRRLVREAYEHAVRERYRFYSYGDCMLIV